MEQKNQRAIYFECYGGISGDMTVAALLDMGADEKELRRQIATLPLEGFSIEISRVKKSGLNCCDFNVVLEKPYHNHDHDVEYLYGHRRSGENHVCAHGDHVGEHIHEHDVEHIHEHDVEHTHKHGAGHIHDHDGHIHRGLKEVTAIIEQSGLTEGAKKIAGIIFHVLAEAEAKAHGETIETVHFHEVGAVDSIVDIAAAAICFDNLGISNVIVPELYEGKGTVRCAHGILPIPVPAVMNIAAQHEIVMNIVNVEAELVTPTGAAIVAAVRTMDCLPKKYTIQAIGLGAGKRDYGRTSILRAMLIKDTKAENREISEDYIYKLESNIDDCTGETLGYVMERLFAEGARDVNYCPVFMKKNRPAYQINIICTEKDIPVMEKILFKETTTIGIRRMRMERSVLEREVRKVETSLGEAQVKVCNVYGEKRIYPEYESVAVIASEKNLSYREVWEKIAREAKAVLLQRK